MLKGLRRLATAALVALPLLTGPAAVADEPPAPRIALVIGNADYDDNGAPTPPELSDANGFSRDLAKPINDADDVEASLRSLGFNDIVSVRNADQVEFLSALDRFRQLVVDKGPRAIVFVYFSGHAMQANSVNYLIPVGARLPGNYDYRNASPVNRDQVIGAHTIRLSTILDTLNNPEGGGVNIVILDSCRNNFWDPLISGVPRAGGAPRTTAAPPRSGGGLAPVVTVDRGGGEILQATLFAYSTSPGTTADDGGPDARNSPYTTALLANLNKRGVDIAQMLNNTGLDVKRATQYWTPPQIPWTNNAPLPNKICLVDCVGEEEEARARQLTTALQRVERLETTLSAQSQLLRQATPLFRPITEADIVAIARNPKREFLPGLLSGINTYAALYGVHSPQRMAHFLAQMAHECDNFRTMQEYASGDAYEGRAILGNTEPGDGRRYKGRGIYQITGRENYRLTGEAIGIDLEAQPELASVPEIAVRIALHYWSTNSRDGVSMNDLADSDDVASITRRINGGLNGLSDRRAKLTIAKAIFGVAGATTPATFGAESQWRVWAATRYLRPAPDDGTAAIAVLPQSTIVTRIDDAVYGADFIRVRATIDGKMVEGFVGRQNLVFVPTVLQPPAPASTAGPVEVPPLGEPSMGGALLAALVALCGVAFARRRRAASAA